MNPNPYSEIGTGRSRQATLKVPRPRNAFADLDTSVYTECSQCTSSGDSSTRTCTCTVTDTDRDTSVDTSTTYDDASARTSQTLSDTTVIEQPLAPFSTSASSARTLQASSRPDITQRYPYNVSSDVQANNH